MKAALGSDPYAYGVIRQDSREYMTVRRLNANHPMGSVASFTSRVALPSHSMIDLGVVFGVICQLFVLPCSWDTCPFTLYLCEQQGAIDAHEFYDRFMAVCGAATAETALNSPGSKAEEGTEAATAATGSGAPSAFSDVHGSSLTDTATAGSHPWLSEAESWFKEMALLIPVPRKRAEMLLCCADVSD
jgi:hypothetical protein